MCYVIQVCQKAEIGSNCGWSEGECRLEAEKRIVRGQLLEQAGPLPRCRRKFKFHFHNEENFTFIEKIIVRGKLQTKRILTSHYCLQTVSRSLVKLWIENAKERRNTDYLKKTRDDSTEDLFVNKYQFWQRWTGRGERWWRGMTSHKHSSEG